VVKTLRHQWQNLTHTHEFSTMLAKLRLTRFEALTLVGSEFVTQIDSSVFRGILQTLTEIQLPIMLFVSNKGVVQIHTGRLHNFKVTGSWLNILDSGFNLHLDEPAIAHLFVVERPASIGRLTSLELYDEDGNNIALLFGDYNPGIGEDPAWREFVSALPQIQGRI